MSTHELLLSVNARRLAKLSRHEFVWRRPPGDSSLICNMGPRCELLGRVPIEHIELVRLAVGVYLTDRTTPRPAHGWERELELTIPVRDPERWDSIAPSLVDLLDFLTSDGWNLRFVRRNSPREDLPARPRPVPMVCLFSGGADSLCGAVEAIEQHGADLQLVSHFDWTITGGVQNRVLDQLESLTGVRPGHLRLKLGRKAHQIGSGVAFQKETTSRSRSLLFLALGLAAAAARDAELWVPENGFASLNVPLAPERRASLSTRTTHPTFLDGLQATLGDAGIAATITNPFENKTKGTLFTELADRCGSDAATAILALTHSCARTDMGRPPMHFTPSTHCGVCFACLVRRGAFLASGLSDETQYVEQEIGPGDVRRTAFLTPKRRQDYEAVRSAERRGVGPADIIRLDLPERVDRDAALVLARTGLAEIAAVTIT